MREEDREAETRVSLLTHDSQLNNNNNNNNQQHEQEKEALAALLRRESRLYIWRHAWQSKLCRLWGAEPPYILQSEDTAGGGISGGLYYTWLGGLMGRAARADHVGLNSAEDLSAEDMPRPTRASRAYNAGIVLSAELQRQRWRRHVWSMYIGVSVRHRRDKLSVGELRWIGHAQQRRTPQELYAGVEWRVPPAHRVKEAERDVECDPFINGEYDGEHLFQTSTFTLAGGEGEGEATATLERVKDIEIVSPLSRKELHGTGMPETSQQLPRCMSVARALFSVFGNKVYILLIVRLVRDACQLSVPVVLQSYIEFLQSTDPQWVNGLLLVLAFAILSLVQSAAANKMTQLGWRAGQTFQNALQAVLFEKCATISRKALMHPEMNVGRIVNMMSSDVSSSSSLPQMVPIAVGAPLQLLVALFLLYRLVSWCAFAGFGVLVVFMPVQGLLMRRYFAAYGALSRTRDARLKATNEFFTGIRVVKFMSWEPSFIQNIEELRRKEVAALRTTQLLYIGSAFLTNAIPAIVIAVVFLLYSAGGNELTPVVVFPTLTLLDIMQVPFIMIPISISSVMRFVVSMRRITRFLECDDTNDGMRELLNEDKGEIVQLHKGVMNTYGSSNMMITAASAAATATTAKVAAAAAAEFMHATISTYVPRKLPPCAKERKAAKKKKNSNGNGKDSSEYYELQRRELLRDITLRIPKGKLTCVVGETGSGKSTLLESLLGELDVTSGVIRSAPVIAYVPQQPWIMNATLKDNILFFSDMNDERFHRALRCTQLESDLLLLANGVETEIGERGINLSGGQKARVSLARAVYASDRDMYLLDDPLSALDAHVGERVLHECILGELRDTTRLLATHQLHILPYADYIVVLQEGGTVAFDGDYEAYKKYMANKAEGKEKEEEEGDNNDKKLEGTDDTTERKNSSNKSDEQRDSTKEEEKEKNGTTMSGDVNMENQDPTKKKNNKDDDNMDDIIEDSLVDASELEGKGTSDTNNDNDNTTKKNNNNNDIGKLMTEEEKATGSVSMGTYMQYLKACGGLTLCILVLLLFIITECLVVAPSLWLSFWSVRRFSLSSRMYLLVYTALVAAGALSSPLRNTTGYAVQRCASVKLHAQLLRSLAVAPMAFFDTTPIGRVLNRFSKDFSSIDGDLQGSVIFFLQSLLSVTSSIVVMAVSQYLILLVLAPCALFYYKLMLFYNSANREMRRIANRANSPVFSVLGEMLAGRSSIAAYGKTTDFLQKAMHRIDTVYACSYIQKVCNCWLAVRIELLSNAVLTSVAFIGVLLVMLRFGNIDVGLVSLSLTMAMNMNSLLKFVVNQSAEVEANMNCVERVLYYTFNVEHEDLLDDIDKTIKEQEQREKQHDLRKHHKERTKHSSNIKNDEGYARITSVPVISDTDDDNNNSNNDNDNINNNNEKTNNDNYKGNINYDKGNISREYSLAEDHEEEEDKTAITTVTTGFGSIVFRDVTMRYRAGLPLVLRGVNFTITPGQKVGIVGRTGSGKSSLLLSFLRIVDIASGSIYINDRPIHDYPLRTLRQLFAMIPQDPLLFNGTIRSNVDRFHNCSDAAVWRALRLVGLHDRISSERDGLQSRVEEGGANFSVGQRQLICMARALLQRQEKSEEETEEETIASHTNTTNNPTTTNVILLMDEATANVDPQLDRHIQHAITHTFAAHTVVTIAHRLQTVAAYDQLLLMEGGRVVEAGPPRELAERGDSKFARMLQSRGETAVQEFIAATMQREP
ncbi:ABC transporter type 1 [Trypanosoma melophagium]|uniref:ABC transporter type 1 n=1 Tax=Trypanosoma melophagium TaxID=715481 RepID=UPI00351AAF2F|nr:ABC transporter type 1 [Trypanosoma melophagium]